MELFKSSDIDFVGRRKYFIGLSLLLLVAGAASLIFKGGLKLGIDFKGGTLVYVKFKDAPDVSRIRQTLTDKGLTVATLQPFTDRADSHELKIDLDLTEGAALTSGRSQIIEKSTQITPCPKRRYGENLVWVGVYSNPTDKCGRKSACIIGKID